VRASSIVRIEDWAISLGDICGEVADLLLFDDDCHGGRIVRVLWVRDERRDERPAMLGESPPGPTRG
jgi:hypothetical protein